MWEEKNNRSKFNFPVHWFAIWYMIYYIMQWHRRTRDTANFFHFFSSLSFAANQLFGNCGFCLGQRAVHIEGVNIFAILHCDYRSNFTRWRHTIMVRRMSLFAHRRTLRDPFDGWTVSVADAPAGEPCWRVVDCYYWRPWHFKLMTAVSLFSLLIHVNANVMIIMMTSYKPHITYMYTFTSRHTVEHATDFNDQSSKISLSDHLNFKDMHNNNMLFIDMNAAHCYWWLFFICFKQAKSGNNLPNKRSRSTRSRVTQLAILFNWRATDIVVIVVASLSAYCVNNNAVRYHSLTRINDCAACLSTGIIHLCLGSWSIHNVIFCTNEYNKTHGNKYPFVFRSILIR